MPGFFVSNRVVNVELQNLYPERCVQKALTGFPFTAKWNTLNKFMHDKALVCEDGYIVLLDGYLLNKTDLLAQYHVDDVAQLAIAMYRQHGDAFFSLFQGGFSGAFCDISADKWLIFTNHSGDSAVFYATDAHSFYAGSQVNYLVDACRSAGMQLSFDESAAYQMLTYGFMADNSTYAQQIKRLRGGTYLYACGDDICVKTYHTYQSDPARFLHSTEDELIELVDRAFRSAIAKEYEKDLEYGYAHLADLSGGLDSRMTMWVAQSMGYAPIQLLTYCKANNADEQIAKEIAAHWKSPLLIKPLDDASFLLDIDELVSLNGGLSLYSGITGGKQLLCSLNMNNYGLEHTGMVGDVILGSWYHSLSEQKLRMPTGRYSEKLSHRLPESVIRYTESYDDHAVFLFYSRGFQGASNTYQIRRNFTEVCSPFTHIEFMQLCMDIPVELRMGHALYKKWILAKYPEAAAFRWEKTGAKITENPFIGKIRRILKRGPKKLLRMMGLARLIRSGMNPLDYWIANNHALRSFMDTYERDGYAYLPAGVSEQLISDMKHLYATGTANEKTMVLTVLASAKLYFGDRT